MDTDTKTIPPALVIALEAKNNGAVENGPSMRHPVENRRNTTHTDFGPIVIKRAPAGNWKCDACGTKGAGWEQIERHCARTDHNIYTEVQAP